MRILFWNCRGIGNAASVNELLELVRTHRPVVLCIVETQISKERVEGLRFVLSYDHCFAVKSDGRSGGLAIYWNNDLSLKVLKFSQVVIDAEIREAGKEPWRVSCFYGVADRRFRFRTWDTMKILKADSDLPWVCIGDFNEVLNRCEQLGA